MSILKSNEYLSEIRNKLKDKINNNMIFTYNGNFISKKDEDTLTLSNIENNSIIKMKKLDIKDYPLFGKKKTPIFGSKYIEDIDDLKIYLYPNIDFTISESEKALTILVLGQSGSGKTTLINSFINFLLGVEFEDEFRYKLILNDLNKSQGVSQTDEVVIYNISSHGNYPPIRIIDTPGLGDTRGIARDEAIIEKIKYAIKDKIDSINSI